MEIKLRKAEIEDMVAIHSLVKELAEYEKGLHLVTTTPESYRRDFLEKVFDAIVAEVEGEIVGMALYFLAFSTWRGKMMYLEEFIVRESMRGHWIGKLLFEAFLEVSKKQDVALVKWQVLHWNEPGINFYRKYPETVFDEEWGDFKL